AGKGGKGGGAPAPVKNDQEHDRIFGHHSRGRVGDDDGNDPGVEPSLPGSAAANPAGSRRHRARGSHACRPVGFARPDRIEPVAAASADTGGRGRVQRIVRQRAFRGHRPGAAAGTRRWGTDSRRSVETPPSANDSGTANGGGGEG